MELQDTLSEAQLSKNTPVMDGLECISMQNFVSVSDQKYRTTSMHQRRAQPSQTGYSVLLARAQT